MASGAGADDLDVLTEVAEVADEVADAQRGVAGRARSAARARRRGASWSHLVESGALEGLFGSLGDSAAKLSRAAGMLRVAALRALLREGWTTRRVGERFGISHQRVSVLQSRRKH